MVSTRFKVHAFAVLSLCLLVLRVEESLVKTKDKEQRYLQKRRLSRNRISNRTDEHLIAHLSNPNETISQELSTLAHSYCDGNDLVEYPLPDYGLCPPDSTLNVIHFFGGMTNAMKFIMLGALMSFEENRCFTISEENAHLNPGFLSGKSQTGALHGESESFVHHFFEEIGLPNDHEFVKEKLRTNNFKYRKWHEFFMDERLRRTQRHNYNFNTESYSHPKPNVNGIELKRDFLRHMWHLKPAYRDNTCGGLKGHNIFDTDYIAISIRRGDKTSEDFTYPRMSEYILRIEPLIPHVFKDGQQPKIFVATDDCGLMPTLREARPTWSFVSQCDSLREMQHGYDIQDIPKFNDEQREEHFKKFFIELYAMAFAKVFVGVSYTNVSWFAYMMRPNIDRSTFVLLDTAVDPSENDLDYW
eukprot:CAMPEP_0178900816 /NCGR_PEP_ID=MMETSP0786-20121207/3677_1 /TAXON_ID=186022 /ORGANISM="Thalassionema frauenfeldii, Strain CCMP 1798" /LENGTH=414 /DNA_ID=CAMNT_0020571849 /DNA_START=89 /DNA_END=1330 /DNA_ORIENTATION=+